MLDKSRRLGVVDAFGKKLNQKFGYGKNRRFGVVDAMICRRRVFIGLRWGVLWFVLGDVVGRWVYWGYRRLYFGTRDKSLKVNQIFRYGV